TSRLSATMRSMNLTLRGSWTELSWHWNFIYLKNVLFYLNRVKPTVIHFAGSQKPWFVDAQIVPRRFASGYRDFLAKHYPDSLQSGVLPVGRRKRFFFARLLVSSLRVVAKLRAYHLRFQDHTVARDPWK
ncbi:MAG: hypothetical protein NWP79_09425, partial [Paracoccaceae bacterium]|nr:hypothetical protein [Paracoccaceae bacterium]